MKKIILILILGAALFLGIWSIVTNTMPYYGIIIVFGSSFFLGVIYENHYSRIDKL